MAPRKKTDNSANSVNSFTVLMNWIRDGNPKSEFPKDLEKSISIVYFFTYFIQHPIYWIFINDLYNNVEFFKLPAKDVFRTLKEIYHYTKYNSFSKKKVEVKDNPLVGVLKKKFPYYKREEIIMIVDIIDNSSDKDTIYEMFEINNVAKVKKATKKDISDTQNKIKAVKSSDDVLSMLM